MAAKVECKSFLGPPCALPLVPTLGLDTGSSSSSPSDTSL